METRTDQELVVAYLEGDPDAFELLVGRHIDGLYDFALRYCGDAADAPDIVQESFLRAWKHLKRYDPSKRFKTWLYSIARNAAVDLMRRRRTAPLSSLLFDGEPVDIPDDEIESIETAIDRSMAVEKIRPIIASLPAEQQMILALRHDEDMTFAEIGETLGIPLNTAKSHYRRALEAIRRKLG